MSNRREFFRVSMRLLEAPVTLVASTGIVRFRAKTVDLSGGGAQILSPRPVKPGDKVHIDLGPCVDDDKPLQLRGRIVWVYPTGRSWQAGIEFGDLTPETRERIVRRVRSEEMRWGWGRTAPAEPRRKTGGPDTRVRRSG
jgi:c-di-GMP-binding flagellar brake protein YcgR